MENKKLTMSEILVYSFGLFGVQAIFGYLNGYQAQFYNKTMAADLAVVGVIMLVARLISSFADPFIGNLMDKSHFKSGKLRPFILISSIPFMLLTVVIFITVPFRGVGLYIYMFITYSLWCISMSFADIPSQGMLAMLTPDPAERNKVAGVSNFVRNVGLSASFVIVPVVCILTQSENGAIGAKEYIVSAIFIAVLGSVLLSLIYFFNKERVPYKQSSATIKEMFFMIKDNKPLMLLLLSALLGFGRSMAMGIQAQAAHALIGDINIGGTVIGGENTILILGGTAGIATAIGMALVPIMTKKLGEKKTFIIFSVYGAVAAGVAYAVYALGITSILSIVIMLFFVGLMYGSHTFLPVVMVSDCVDYYELKTGKRTEGVHFAVLTFSIKVTMAMSVAVGLIFVSLSGYNANATEFSMKTKNVIYMAYVLVPGISCVLSMLPILSYKLVGKEKERIAKELAERRLSAEN